LALTVSLRFAKYHKRDAHKQARQTAAGNLPEHRYLPFQ
jgi:hypothetical protein